tara:strand:+ start:4146 stop:4763 length:618 start_codon:yes stop_codon:yes gene_type:complete
MVTKKAAMFGLDARIALAIFGALSVISGAALYSAIQDSKVTALVTEMNDIVKAWEQYYLDTGSMLPRHETSDSSQNSFYSQKTIDLVEDNGVNGWAGPYLSYATDSSGGTLKHPEYYHINMNIIDDNGTLGTTGSWVLEKCTSGKTCSLWLQVNGIPNETLASAIDAKIDGTVDKGAGNLRWYDGGGVGAYRIHWKITGVSNPHG